MLVTTIIAMVIIDHFGRKKLMIIGSIGYILSLGCAVYAFFTGGVLFLLSLLVFVAAHGFGQGAVIWALVYGHGHFNVVPAFIKVVGRLRIWDLCRLYGDTITVGSHHYAGNQRDHA
jgi:MFS family permease